jgi:apolipoprotein N-acyltransferase
LALFFAFPLIAFVLPSARRLRRSRWLGTWLVVLLVITMFACGGGSHRFVSTSQSTSQSTPTGAFNLNVTAQSGNITGQTTVLLTVK